jgi:methoxymalonate biosynthesis protein
VSQPAVTVVKCLVWDLDNTLWQGTLAEGDEVTVDEPVRLTVRELDRRGILQSIASRNEHDHAWAQLERLGLAEYFVVPQIGWGRKSDAVAAIAAELEFAAGTIAFIDDQPAERAEVALRLPEVRCLDAGQAGKLAELPDFRPATVTPDARRRRQLYQTAVRRNQARADYSGSDEEFLQTLQVVLTLVPADQESLARVEELTLRTSQMNATGVIYSQPELRALLPDEQHELLVATVTDRFGPHGAVGVVLLRLLERTWHLKLLATSCRVVPLGIGGAILRWLVDQAARAGAHLVADFRPTGRNRIMEVTYRFAGFGPLDCAGCAARLAPPEPEQPLQRLHLVPARGRAGPLRIDAPELTERQEV